MGSTTEICQKTSGSPTAQGIGYSNLIREFDSRHLREKRGDLKFMRPGISDDIPLSLLKRSADSAVWWLYDDTDSWSYIQSATVILFVDDSAKAILITADQTTLPLFEAEVLGQGIEKK